MRYYVCKVWWTKKVNNRTITGSAEILSVIAHNKNEAVKKAKKMYWSFRKRKRVPKNIITHVEILESGKW